jgi:hypothetical protein
MTVIPAAGTYVHWGVFNVSVTNIAIIAVMIIVFVLAILLPFPHGDEAGARVDGGAVAKGSATVGADAPPPADGAS